MAYGMEINRGGQCSKDNKGRAKEEGALILQIIVCGKNISAPFSGKEITGTDCRSL